MTKNYKFKIPIYPIKLLLNFSDDPNYLRKTKMFGGYEKDYSGLTFYNNEGWIGLFFQTKGLSHGTIAHECHHATDYISDHCQMKCGEAKAYLNEYLNEIVIKYAKKNKFKIKT